LQAGKWSLAQGVGPKDWLNGMEMPLIETKRGQDVGKTLHQDLEVKLPFQLPAGQFRTLLGAE